MTHRFAFALALASLVGAGCSSDGSDGSGGATPGTGGAAGTTTSSGSPSSATGPSGSGAGGAAGSGGGASTTGTQGAGGTSVTTGSPAGSGGGPQTEPDVGATAIAQLTIGQAPDAGSLDTSATTTQSGSIFLLSLARGDWASAPDAPTDSFGNAWSAIGGSHTYASWPTSATGLYRSEGAVGGEGHVFTMTHGASDEVSLSAVEVVGATAVVADSWVERGASSALTSDPVHVDGPAVLVAWWWGSGGVRPEGTSHVADPGDGFTLLPNATGLVSLSNSGYIQVAAAYRVVDAAGDFAVSWTTDDEGAQLYLVALQ